MATPATVVSAEEYERIALAEPERRWELHGGRLVEKPPMSMGHDLGQLELMTQLMRQLDLTLYKVQFAAKLRRGDGHFYIPDLCVIPISMIEPDRERRRRLNVYSDPVPLVVEVWSPSTGDYDVDEKIPEYQGRGDQEIWRLHYFERTLSAWRRQPDRSYIETEIHERTVSPVAFPWVTIDLDAVFA